MAHAELAHLELLAEVDALADRLRRWADAAPDWPPAEDCRALVRRFTRRIASLRIRLDAPLVAATLGGSGTGKSALINALLGAEVATVGRQRPTTLRPTLFCRPEITPAMLGIDAKSVDLVQLDLPALAHLVLVDCPDPDTTEDVVAGNATAPQTAATTADAAIEPPETHASETNLARLRQILPHCDVLLVTTTQQKYRSARVADELAAAASGARLVFVQTHADVEEDIRADWVEAVGKEYMTGHVFLVDSMAALADVQRQIAPRGEFAALVDLLTRQLAGKSAARIRRANFLDLTEQVLALCRRRLDETMPGVRQVRAAVDEQRAALTAQLAQQMRAELLASRRSWENRLLGQVVSRWGLSPFALTLRVFQGLGGLMSARLLWRARTPAQMALWGAAETARVWRRRTREQEVQQSADRAATACWDQTELRSASVILDGYAVEAGLPRKAASLETVAHEAARAGENFVASVATDLESLLARLAQRHTGWFTRWRYELLLAAVLGLILYRLGKNFFYDSWLAAQPVPVVGIEFYLSAGFWLLLWCLALIWMFTGRLRRGLRQEVDRLAEGRKSSAAVDAIFGRLEAECRQVERFRQDLDRLEDAVGRLRRQVATLPNEELGHRKP